MPQCTMRGPYAGLMAASVVLAPCAVHAACTVSASGANFGTYTGTALQGGASPIIINCPAGSAWQIGVNPGLHAGSGNYAWRLQNGSDMTFLPYQLYRDAARSQYWGGSLNFDTITGTGTGTAQTVYTIRQSRRTAR